MPILLLRQLALHIIFALTSSHLAREHPRRNRVDPDLNPLVRDLGRKHLGQVDGSCFAGVVREVALGLEDNTGDGGDVDDGARVSLLVFRGALEERQEGTGHEVDLGDVGLVLGGPVVEFLAFGVEEVVTELLCVLACRRDLAGGVDAGVVDQDAEALLARFNFFGQAQDVFLAGDVGNERDDLA